MQRIYEAIYQTLIERGLVSVLTQGVYEYDRFIINAEEMQAEHSGIPHGGFVVRGGTTGVNGGQQHVIEYRLKLDSNPEFTASVLTAYARAAWRLFDKGESGCMTVFDIAPKYLSEKSHADLLKTLL
jgi:diaminopimelate dehydrogenase